MDPIFADAASFFYYWPRQLVAWGVLGLLAAGFGVGIAWVRWKSLRVIADGIEVKMRALTNEQARIKAQLREGQEDK